MWRLWRLWRLWRHSLKSAALFFDLLLCCHEGVDISNVSLSKRLCLGMSIYAVLMSLMSLGSRFRVADSIDGLLLWTSLANHKHSSSGSCFLN